VRPKESLLIKHKNSKNTNISFSAVVLPSLEDNFIHTWYCYNLAVFEKQNSCYVTCEWHIVWWQNQYQTYQCIIGIQY